MDPEELERRLMENMRARGFEPLSAPQSGLSSLGRQAADTAGRQIPQERPEMALGAPTIEPVEGTTIAPTRRTPVQSARAEGGALIATGDPNVIPAIGKGPASPRAAATETALPFDKDMLDIRAFLVREAQARDRKFSREIEAASAEDRARTAEAIAMDRLTGTMPRQDRARMEAELGVMADKGLREAREMRQQESLINLEALRYGQTPEESPFAGLLQHFGLTDYPGPDPSTAPQSYTIPEAELQAMEDQALFSEAEAEFMERQQLADFIDQLRQDFPGMFSPEFQEADLSSQDIATLRAIAQRFAGQER